MTRQLILICMLGLMMINVHAKTINSLSITKATLSAAINNGSCLHYRAPTRFCVWFSPLTGKNVTPFLDHYLPDVVVLVYRNRDENPWTEARILFDKISAMGQDKLIAHAGSGNHPFMDAHEQQVIFKEADVIGNPGLLALISHFNLLLLPSTAKPMQPYFQSMLDSVLWRGMIPEALPEETASLALSFTHYVGMGINNWGGVYPHEGSVMGNDDAKASMVIAERAADLLTNQMFTHIHQPLSNACGAHCKVAPITENSQETLFQMIYPIEQDKCDVLGSDDSYSSNMLSDDGAYAWIVWRHYQGCIDGEGQFIGVV